jgi:flagellar biosynthetic protein FliR
MEWLNQLPAFLLIFTRMTAFFVTAPIFSMRQIPRLYKWGTVFFISLLCAGIVSPSEAISINHMYYLLVLKESILGLALGFVASLFLYAVQIAGSFIDLQTGFAMATLFDPSSGTSVPITGSFKRAITILFFLSSNAHHLLLKGILISYEWIPITQWIPDFTKGTFSEFLLETFSHIFIIAFLIAGPFIGVLFLVDLALGIMGKATPQMNVIVVGLPIKIIVHFIVFFLAVPSFFYLIHLLLTEMVESLERMIRLLGV